MHNKTKEGKKEDVEFIYECFIDNDDDSKREKFKYKTSINAISKFTRNRLLGKNCLLNEYKKNRHGYYSWHFKM